MNIPNRLELYDGYDNVVPLVTKENEDGTNRRGLLFNRGWIPHEWH